MKIEKILKACDHTLLSQTATESQIKSILDDAMKYKVASACIPPCYVKMAKEYIKDNLKICTVIGFPNGNVTSAVKLLETVNALENGADEIDMVINNGKLKDKDYTYV